MRFRQHIQGIRNEKDRGYRPVSPNAQEGQIKNTARDTNCSFDDFAICICCGKASKMDRIRTFEANAKRTDINAATTICIDCSKKKFPRFYV